MRKYEVTGHSKFGWMFWVHLEAVDNREMGGFSCIQAESVPAAGEIVEADKLGSFEAEVYWHGERINHVLSERKS